MATVLFGGGGTAGHVTPALATAEALAGLQPGLEIAFVGTQRGIESTMVPAHGWSFHEVPAAPLRRGFSPADLAANLRVPMVVRSAARRVSALMEELDTVAACVFGGYVSGPLALAARRRRIPLVIHEQNAVPGLANRIAARWAVAVASSVPGVEARFPHPERVKVTGNPVRRAIADLDRDAAAAQAREEFDLAADRRTLLAFGGSLGARRINEALVSASALWVAPGDVQVLHVAGRSDHDRCAAAWSDALTGNALAVRCLPFIERMELAYAVADVVLCRSGASTIAELTALGLPSVLVPYPHAVADEQTANAHALEQAGAAVLVPDRELDARRLVEVAEPILADERRRAAMSAAARALGRPSAAETVAHLILEAMEGTT